MLSEQPVALTEFAKASGCGCKISPSALEEILQSQMVLPADDRLLVGNGSRDDAAVYRLSDFQSLIATTDFFTPIVDNPYQFGQIAAANALSDVYAMGGNPILALAILGWPLEKLSPATAREVLEGARSICLLAGVPLAGGHSIESQEPIFGLSVNGLVDTENLKRNDTAREGDLLFLTKPIGLGILAAACKRKLIEEAHYTSLIEHLTHLNKVGYRLGALKGVTAMTDVTGFGLLGHLYELASGSGLAASIEYAALPVLDAARAYAAQRIVPDATYRNWNNYSAQVRFEPGVNVMEAFNLLPDPQTNGGLLIAVRPEAVREVQELLADAGYTDYLQPIGRLEARAGHTIIVR